MSVFDLCRDLQEASSSIPADVRYTLESTFNLSLRVLYCRYKACDYTLLSP